MEGGLIENEQEQFIKKLELLDLSNGELASRLQSWGDLRKIETIVRSIQRMKSQEIPISGEMKVILNMLLIRKRESSVLYNGIKWETDGKGIVSTQIADGHKISLYPESKGRWRVIIRHSGGYVPAWPIFPKNLDDAKRKALLMLEDTIMSFETGVLSY